MFKITFFPICENYFLDGFQKLLFFCFFSFCKILHSLKYSVHSHHAFGKVSWVMQLKDLFLSGADNVTEKIWVWLNLDLLVSNAGVNYLTVFWIGWAINFIQYKYEKGISYSLIKLEKRRRNSNGTLVFNKNVGINGKR